MIEAFNSGHGAAWVMLGAIAIGGCGDAIGPAVRYDPGQTLHRLEEVLVPLESDGDFLLALDLAVATLDYYGATAFADAVSLRPERHEGLMGAVRAASRFETPTAGDGRTAAFTVPWDIRGETLEWDALDGYVPGGRSGAPVNGVRLLLYRMDDRSGYPRTPLSPIGYIDITDEDQVTYEALRVRAVRTDGPDRVVADYQVSLEGGGTYEDGWMEVVTWGAVGGTGSVTLELFQRLIWSRAGNRDALTLDYRYVRGGRSVELEGLAVGPFEALEWDTFDFDLWFRGGSATQLRAEIGRNGSLAGEIRNEGHRVIRISGTDGRPHFRKANGGGLSATETAALTGLWTGIADLIWFTDWIVTPADLLVLDG